jgi:hypothetical protein
MIPRTSTSAPEDLDRFVASFVGTFGGTASKGRYHYSHSDAERNRAAVHSLARRNLVRIRLQDPDSLSLRSRKDRISRGDLDAALRAAQTDGADIIVAPFPDPIGRDVVIQWPGGVNMQLYIHTTPPSYEKLQTIPENRVYLSSGKADEFVKDFLRFSRGKWCRMTRMRLAWRLAARAIAIVR